MVANDEEVFAIGGAGPCDDAVRAALVVVVGESVFGAAECEDGVEGGTGAACDDFDDEVFVFFGGDFEPVGGLLAIEDAGGGAGVGGHGGCGLGVGVAGCFRDMFDRGDGDPVG